MLGECATSSPWLNQEAVTVRQHWVDYQDIPAALSLAVIAAEDQRFPEHYGIDTQATVYAIRRAWAGRPGGGGSTLTQQLVKNLFLWPKKSYVRKGIEWLLAIWIELFWDKQRILEVYLNIVQFSRQDYGVAAASQYLLGKELMALTHTDAALLISVLPAPERYDLKKPSRYMRQRQRHILKQMRQLGGVTYLERLKE